MTSPDDVAAAVADAHRREWGFVLAATARVARSIDLAEECVQDAYGAALDAWLRDGIPTSPGAWLTTAARRRALDVLRREQTLRRKLPLLVEPEETPAGRPPARGSRTTGCGWSSPAVTRRWPGRPRLRSRCGWSAV